MKMYETKTDTREEEKYDLVRGTFTPDQALEITNLLIHTKVNFFKLQNLSHHMRFGTTDEALRKKVNDMETSKASIEQLIKEAKLKGKSLKVYSNITISLL